MLDTMDDSPPIAPRPGSPPRRWGRYTLGARLYDVLSLEWPIYRPGRQAAIDLLDLRPGERVLDVGCGTGLNFALLQASVGPAGMIVGVDRSGQMLARARARVRRRGWQQVRLVQADAGAAGLAGSVGSAPFDAVLFTYSLSVIEDGAAAWRSALALVRPGGRIAVADLALPAGRWRPLAPLARLACASGGVRRGRRVWEWVGRDTVHVRQLSLRAGHIRVAAGTTRSPAARPPSERG